MRAIIAALVLAVVGSGAAAANPVTLNGNPVGLGPALPVGVSDAFNVFVNGTLYPIIHVTPAGEKACADPVSILGACSFSAQGFQVGNIIISPKKSISNQIAVFFEPNGKTISDIFLIGCEAVPGSAINRDPGTGLCIGNTNWSILTADSTGFIDYSSLVAGLSAVNMSVGFVGTESAANFATGFGANPFISVTGNINRLPIFANFLSRNDVPEPFTLSLFGAGLAGAMTLRRKKKTA